jgi:hypothetical protein
MRYCVDSLDSPASPENCIDRRLTNQTNKQTKKKKSTHRDVDGKVQVAVVALVGLAADLALNKLAVLAWALVNLVPRQREWNATHGHGEGVLEVEDGLFPVGVLGGGARREGDGGVAHAEIAIKVHHKRVHVVGPAHIQPEGRGEGQVRLGARPNVNLLQIKKIKKKRFVRGVLPADRGRTLTLMTQ